MKRTTASIVLVASMALVLVVLVAWTRGATTDAGANLDGAPVTVSPAAQPTAEPSAAPPATTGPPAAPSTTVEQVTLAQPRQLIVPAIGVDSPIVAVGLEADGSMEIPGASEAGWYKYGPRPGEYDGSSVIAAHVDFNGSKGVFFDLRRLEIGAEITVVDDRGERHSYTVTERFQVDKSSLPTQELFRIDGPQTLTLITCGGIFDSSERSYVDNIVVRATPVIGR